MGSREKKSGIHQNNPFFLHISLPKTNNVYCLHF
ncbi:hypothetical protein E2C01_034733 [Portunus trituberculatus]|uniref:Uncharacterized protein n=1 Tax=Portunus trituberculatus TaxID=210409 RepID=A0A5B7F7P9_PORTR|nr:hypothetical protein [Portunus trituberculatus]